MAVTFDPEKNARNIAERGLSFERVADLDWETAVICRGHPPRLQRAALARHGRPSMAVYMRRS
jgi:uncharacterized DUF497 family protein